jgi:mycofactocin precursor
MTLSTEDTLPETPDANQSPTDAVEAPVDLVEEDLLVEDVSIDGMCGVY